MLEGLILGVFLMSAQQAAPPAAPATELQSSSSSAADAAPADAAAPAEQPATEAAPTAPAEQPAATTNTTNNHDQNRVRCRRGPPEIGSIMGRRICTTEAQDRARAQRDAAELERMQQRDNH